MLHVRPSIARSAQGSLWRWWCGWTIVLACIAGTVLALPHGSAMRFFDVSLGGQLLAISLWLELARAKAPGVALAATILSAVCWSQGMEQRHAEQLRRSMVHRAVVQTILGSYLVLLVGTAVGCLVAREVYLVPTSTFRQGVSLAYRPSDIGFHFVLTLAYSAVAGVLWWCCLPTAARWQRSLTSKVLILGCASAAIRISASLVLLLSKC